MIALEITLMWASVALYLANAVMSWVALLWRLERILRLTIPLLAVGLLVHAVPLVARWIRVGHGPYINTYEVVSASVFVGLAAFAVLGLRRRELRLAAGPILTLGVILMGWAVVSSPEIQPLPPTFRSPWLVVHVISAKIAFGAILLASGLSVVYLLRAQARAAWKTDENLQASLSGMDRFAHRSVAFGFVFIGFMILSGAIWAREAWGSYWSWDPLETWSLATWVAYGLALHLRMVFKVRGRPWTLVVLGLLVLSLFLFFAAVLVTSTDHTEFMVQ